MNVLAFGINTVVAVVGLVSNVEGDRRLVYPSPSLVTMNNTVDI